MSAPAAKPYTSRVDAKYKNQAGADGSRINQDG
jgi:hypothetical protein